jgi:hypothetical protein
MTTQRPIPSEAPGHGRTVALVVMLMLITVLLYQVIDTVQRRAYQRRREIRRQEWREWREREFQRNLAFPATQPEPGDGSSAAASPGVGPPPPGTGAVGER